jgi:hypothetical protein
MEHRGDFFIVVYSESLTIKVENNINRFIESTFRNGVQFVIVGLISIAGIVLLITCITTRKIRRGITCAKSGIAEYTRHPQNYPQVLQELLSYDSGVKLFHEVIRRIYENIKIIEYKKQKFRKIGWKFDELPMNWLEEGFMHRQKFRDVEKMREIKKIIQSHNDRL